MGRRLIGFGIAALAVGLIPAMVLSENRRLSVQLWLIVGVVWLAWSLMTAVLRLAPPVPARFDVRWWRRRSRVGKDIDGRPRSLQAIQGTILASRDSGRAYALRLRPRLTVLADHQLALHHGINRMTEPERAEATLGDLAWLIGNGTEQPRPTLDEIDRLLDILGVPDPGSTEAGTT